MATVSSRAALAECLGVTADRLGDLLRAGLPGAAADGSYDVAAAFRWMLANARGRRTNTDGPDVGLTIDEVEARKRSAHWLAEQRRETALKIKRENELAAGELLRREDVESALSAAADIFRRDAEAVQRAAVPLQPAEVTGILNATADRVAGLADQLRARSRLAPRSEDEELDGRVAALMGQGVRGYKRISEALDVTPEAAKAAATRVRAQRRKR